jgi:type I restriction enzyme, R subunit
MARGTVELDEVERPFVEQLKAMGWRHLHGPELPGPDDQRGYGDVLLARRLGSAIRRINRVSGTGEPWMGDGDVESAVGELRRAARNVATQQLKDVNSEVTSLLLSGTPATGHEVHHQGKTVHVQYVDWELEGLGDAEILKRNEFLVVDQLRVRAADGKDVILDLVLFVNGIPVVVIECKSPDVKDPTGKAIRDLRAYCGEPLDDDVRAPHDRPSGVPELFASVQLLVAASGDGAALGTITSTEEHFAAWRSVTPDYDDDAALARALHAVRQDDGRRLLADGQKLTDQHRLAAIVLKPRNLLNIMRHYVFDMPVNTKEGEPPLTVKAVCRHQQYRAVEKIVAKLRSGRTRLDPAAEDDERGGVIWHTQGSGKSLTMAFLARRLQSSRDPELNRFTLLVVTDRKQLERQLSAAVRVSGRPVRIAKSQADVEGMLRRAGKPGGRAVIFAMIQKYLGRIPGLVAETANDERDPSVEFVQAQDRVADGESAEEAADPTPTEDVIEKVRRRFSECSTSPYVLVLVDEAHRSHSSVLHACLRDAVPNAARIGFTGTPIMKGKLYDTGRIFGLEPDDKFLDAYLMDEAERDKVVVPVRYEGRAGPADVKDERGINFKFEDLIATLSGDKDKDKVRKGLKPTSRDVAESLPIIRSKAVDMLEHYVTGPLTGGFKAQVAAVSRRAAVLYRHMLNDARAELLARVADFDPATLRDKDLKDYTWDELVLLRAWHYQELLRRIEFVPVISAGNEQKGGAWQEWTDPLRQEEHIKRFLDPFPELPKDNPWMVDHPLEPDPVPGGVIAMNPWSDVRTGPSKPATERERRPVAFLIVKSMLLTGFDAPIEQVLYLDRPIQDAELLQAIARVNRPRTGKEEGRVVDYYGVLNNLAVTLPAYKGDGPALSAVRRLSSEVPDLEAAAVEMRRFLDGLGVTRLDTAEGVTGGLWALGDRSARADFDAKLGVFLGALERVLPHEAALKQIPSARQWAVLQRRVRRHYRDDTGGQFAMRAYGRKVRAMIADHLELPELTQVIAPVSILAPDFDEAVGRVPEVRESAAEQVQALRYHLEERLEQDERPVYRTLAQELREILDEFEGRWEEIQQRVGPLIDRARKAEQADPAVADLSPVEQRLYTKLSEQLAEQPAFDQPSQEFLRDLTVELGSVISVHVNRASWSANESSLGDLRIAIWHELQKAGLKPRERDHKPLRALSNAIAGYAQQHAAAFRARGRGQ